MVRIPRKPGTAELEGTGGAEAGKEEAEWEGLWQGRALGGPDRSHGLDLGWRDLWGRAGGAVWWL